MVAMIVYLFRWAHRSTTDCPSMYGPTNPYQYSIRLEPMQNEGTWLHDRTGAPLSYVNWAGTEPNNGGNEHCINIIGDITYNGLQDLGHHAPSNAAYSWSCEKNEFSRKNLPLSFFLPTKPADSPRVDEHRHIFCITQRSIFDADCNRDASPSTSTTCCSLSADFIGKCANISSRTHNLKIRGTA